MPPALEESSFASLQRGTAFKKLPVPLEWRGGKWKDWDQTPAGSKGWEDTFQAVVLIISPSLLPLFLSLGSFSSFCSYDGVSPPGSSLLSWLVQLLCRHLTWSVPLHLGLGCDGGSIFSSLLPVFSPGHRVLGQHQPVLSRRHRSGFGVGSDL